MNACIFEYILKIWRVVNIFRKKRKLDLSTLHEYRNLLVLIFIQRVAEKTDLDFQEL